MKKLIALVVVVMVLAAVWWASRSRREASASMSDPLQTVNGFMQTAAKVSRLMWDESAKEDIGTALKDLEEGRTKEARAVLRKYDIEDPALFFEDEELGRASLTALCTFRFESFSVQQQNREGNTATVRVEFPPSDILGLTKTLEELGAPPPQMKEEPVVVVFDLERGRGGWKIARVAGELQRLTKAVYKLRKLR